MLYLLQGIVHVCLRSHVADPKACTEGTVMSSTFLSNCTSSAAQDVGTRNHTVSHVHIRHTLKSSNMNMRVRSFSSPIFELIFGLSFIRFTPTLK